jgi:nitrite reductase (NO-forming)
MEERAEMPAADAAEPPWLDELETEAEERSWRQWMLVGVGLTGLVAVLAILVGVAALIESKSGDDAAAPVASNVSHDHPAPAAKAAAPTLADSKGVEFEKFQRVDPTLPPVPPGPVKKFRVDVMQHVTQVDPELAPTEAWTYTVNGKEYRGTAASPPIVVNEGDRGEITFVNGGSEAMKVTMPHSIDFHSAEVAPDRYYVDIAPGEELKIPFTAKHPGVFMYHCATQPVLTHVANGMAGMMVVKPKGLAPVDRELWITQQEFYLGEPGKTADQAKMEAKTPDVIAFNGYANQYKESPITVKKGERIRMYVLDAGPSMWSAFHVIGTVFDRTVVEGTPGAHSQTINLAPSQGGWVEFTLDQEGSYPFVTHAFGDMVNGAAGMLRTENAPEPKAETAPKPAAGEGGVNVELGEMFVKPSTTTVKAGKVTFNVANGGESMHSLAITTDPPKLDGAEPAKGSAIAESKMLSGGESTTLTADLKPGKYVLYCTMGGHYMAGQKIAFTVE